METLQSFLKTNPHTNDLEFTQTDIFPQAKLFKPFGLGVQENVLSLHWGTFFQKKKIFLFDIFAPFTFEEVEYLEDLDMVVLHSIAYGFSLRVYFVSYETLTLDFWDALDTSSPLPARTKIGKSGKILGSLQPFSTYVELYADSPDSILPELFLKKFPDFSLEDFTKDFIQSYADINCIGVPKLWDCFRRTKEKESIDSINSFSCVKHDDLLDKTLTFYSYSSMF